MRIICSIALGMVMFASVLVSPTWAATICDDFEDMDLDGWAQSNSGGTATFNVVDKNSSYRAHVRHVSNTDSGDQSSLSITFPYEANDRVSFDRLSVTFAERIQVILV